VWAEGGRHEELAFEQNRKAISQLLHNNHEERNMLEARGRPLKPLHLLYVYNLRMLNRKDHVLRMYGDDIICQDVRLIKQMPLWHESVDFSLRAYLRHFWLERPSLRVMVLTHLVECQYPQAVAQAVAARQAEPIRVRQGPLLHVQLFRAGDGPQLWNGVLVYQHNRLICRLGHALCTPFDLLLADPARKPHPYFGIVTLDPSLHTNLLKTDLLRQDARLYLERTVLPHLKS
jgi:hypothetical protein